MPDMILEWIGYTASLVILISLLMSSIKKLRWINLFGAILFSFYGFMIASIPTGLMNASIALVDIYFLYKIYSSKEYFKIMHIKQDYEFLNEFIKFYKQDIKKISSFTIDDVKRSEVKMLILRNMNPAGIFIAEKLDNKTLEIVLDYAIPRYRDLKIARHIFKNNREYFKELGYKKFFTESSNPTHIKYLYKTGFVSAKYKGRKGFVKEI
ncbi:MAG: hypothetical protein K9L74_01440 [Candidatus Izimaplasma sp.]|nr:hypothetical protein [Candidatus Izimaplasma bacterium]